LRPAGSLFEDVLSMRVLALILTCIVVDSASVCPPALKPLCELIGGVGDAECVLKNCGAELKACEESPTCSSGQFSFMKCKLFYTAAVPATSRSYCSLQR